MKNIKDFVSWSQTQSRSLSFIEPIDIFLIIEKLAGLGRSELMLNPEIELSDLKSESLFKAAEQRLAGRPLAYILGEKYFFKDLFYVNEGVLIPRSETELMVEWGIDFLNSIGFKNKNLVRFIDIGCGSGCVGLSIAKYASYSQGVLVDISEAATNISEINKKNLNLQNVRIDKSDFLSFRSDYFFDLIVANPPYISKNDLAVEEHVKQYEPHLALYSEEEGLFHIRNWIQRSTRILNPKCTVIFEIGSSQGSTVKKIFEDLDFFRSIEVKKDYAGKDRFIFAQK
jgi:release factor glutamine methyltransferase